MRVRASKNGISVNAIAGTNSILFGLNCSDSARKNLLGFCFERKKSKLKRWAYLPAPRMLEEDGVDHPVVQSFLWNDYVIDAEEEYDYRIYPVYKKEGNIKRGAPLTFTIKTEDPYSEEHGVFFNRGVAGSQAYSRQFSDHQKWYEVQKYGRNSIAQFIKPSQVPDYKAYRWLSRGLEEALLKFIGKARGKQYALRACLYELTYLPAIEKFVDMMESGADVKIIHHAKRRKVKNFNSSKEHRLTVIGPDGQVQEYDGFIQEEELGDAVYQDAREAIGKLGVKEYSNVDRFRSMFIERRNTSAISHNKFIVLLKDEVPIEVWTGSTNLTEGGIFGQSNVGHIVRDRKIANQYFEYWLKLSTDPKEKSRKNDPPYTGIANWTVKQQADFKRRPRQGVKTIFSPRLDSSILEWYASSVDKARNSVFCTLAFSMDNKLFEVFKSRNRPEAQESKLRYLLLETAGGHMKTKYPALKDCIDNRIAIGDTLEHTSNKGALRESLTGLNDHVSFIHTKYLILDALSEDPLLVTGSANFSKNSVNNNDENMLVIRGNTRVVDVYLCEFVRLFKHFEARNSWKDIDQMDLDFNRPLIPNDSWTDPYFNTNHVKYRERLLFA